MSVLLKTIKNTGINNIVDLDVTQFFGSAGSGPMLQLTQGMGELSAADPSFIHLTTHDVYRVVQELVKWLKCQAECKSKTLKIQIENDKTLQKTIFEEAVRCSDYIKQLELINIPLQLLNVYKGMEETQQVFQEIYESKEIK